MQAFSCVCGQPLFFHNLHCLNCGRDVGYDPEVRTLWAVEPTQDGLFVSPQDTRAPRVAMRECAHRTTAAACNWLIPAHAPETICRACQLTRTIPPLDRPRNAERLREIEAAKRRVLYALQRLDLPLEPKRGPDDRAGLAFDFLEAIPGEAPVITGHADGLITLNVAEADPDYREKHREGLHEPYRTLVGHFRHELGHYYWDRLVWNSEWLEPFRELFGDERASYTDALDRHYREGPPADWASRCISSYASMHPWEDWAETWAHFLHIRSTLETVSGFGLDTTRSPLRVTPFTRDVLYRHHGGAPDEGFLKWINSWVVLTATLNEVSRSMGQPDIYPFVMNGPAVTKLHFVQTVVAARRNATAPVLTESLVLPEV
jgi:hypothetical protein